MTYKGLLELYKKGKLDEVTNETVKNDIERQSAISEYLFDEECSQDDCPDAGKETVSGDSIDIEATNPGLPETDFTKIINRSIKRLFVKTGFIIGAVVLAVVLITLLAIPKIREAVYYNPCELIDDSDTQRIDLDMAVFTELFYPNEYRDAVDAVSLGDGNYSISIKQTLSYTGLFYDFGGTINKGNLLLYNSNLFNKMAINDWKCTDVDFNDFLYGEGLFESREDNFEALDKLDENDHYLVYVSLNKIMNYSEFDELCNKYSLYPEWCKLCFKNTVSGINDNEAEKDYYTDLNIGFSPNTSGCMLSFDSEKYPYLIKTSMCDLNITDEIMTTHVLSLLDYMNGQDKFLNMMGYENAKDLLAEYAENIRSNGLYIYGFSMIADGIEIRELRNIPEVEYITSHTLRYE